MSEIGVGLLGFGLAGRTFHAPLIEAVPGLRLVAVGTRQHEAVAERYPAAVVHADPRDVIRDPAVGLVVVATPNDTHAELATAALEAGHHVVVDKPITTTAAEAQTLIALAGRAGRCLVPFHNRRWDADFLTLSRCLDGGLLGEVREWHSHFDRYRPAIKDNWREEPGAGAGLLYDLAPHLADQVMARHGLPDWVSADVVAQRDAAQVDDYFHLVLAWGPVRAVLHAGTLVRGETPRLAVHGTAGSFVSYGLDGQEAALKAGHRPGEPGFEAAARLAPPTLTSAPGGVPLTAAVTPDAGAYTRFYTGVRDAVSDGAPPPVPATAGLNALRVVEAARRSAEEGRRIPL